MQDVSDALHVFLATTTDGFRSDRYLSLLWPFTSMSYPVRNVKASRACPHVISIWLSTISAAKFSGGSGGFSRVSITTGSDQGLWPQLL